MTEVATGIERVSPVETPAEGVLPVEYVFKTTDTVPPRFARVEAKEHGYEGERYFTLEGPYIQEQWATIKARDDGKMYSDEEHRIVHTDSVGYKVNMTDWLHITGNYPGGRDQVALNLARLVLGA